MSIISGLVSLRGSTVVMACALATFVLFAVGGCSSSSTEQGKDAKVEIDKPVDARPPAEKKPAEPPKPDLAKLWQEQAEKVGQLIEADQLDAAEAGLRSMKGLYGLEPVAAPAEVSPEAPEAGSPNGESTLASEQPASTAENAPSGQVPTPALTGQAATAVPQEKPSVEQLKQYEQLAARLGQRRAELAAIEREELLAAAKEAFQKQDYNSASGLISQLLAISPTAQQLEQAQAIRGEIERILSRQRELRSLIRMLGSQEKEHVRSAESQLAAEPDVALSLLIEAVKSKDDTLLVRNALGLMRRMKRPDVALPAMVSVLANEAQKASWEDAVREISMMGEPGAGEPLLKLILDSKDSEQRAAALQSLVSVVDPPAETQIALLPIVMQGGPELTQALRALHRCVRVHGAYDAAAERNLDLEITPEQSAQLSELPARLEAIMAAPTDAGNSPEAAYEAKVLAMATRRQEPQVLTGLKVYGFGSEMEDSPAAAVLDGVWDSVDYKTQWRHAATDQSSIIIDLGEERTVVGVRIWNFNEPSNTHRGWKEAAVFVSDKPRIFDPVSIGIVPMAPGAADTPDYSTLIPVDFVRGRYVKLQAKSLWRADAHTGLAEVQVIGF